MPTGRDAELVRETLERSGISAFQCESAEKLVEAISFGAGAALLAEEAVENDAISQIIDFLEGQPIWSDLPVILFSSHSRNAESLLETLGSRINVTIVERPIRITMLISAVRAALRARQRQYQTRDLLRQLEEADRQKDLFLATLSHELRTPLNSILGWIQILRGRSNKVVDVGHAIDVIERNAMAQAEMIADILFVSRVITGKLELRLDPVDVVSVVQTAIDVVRPSAEAKNINLTFHSDFDDTPIEADADRLRQVFLNLLTNAVKFTPDEGAVSVAVHRRGQNVEIEVCDTGQGIEKEFLPYIFERFRQADNTYTRRVGGLGLGLAIVRHLVELHGGTVQAHSEGRNCGTRFVISLPLLDMGTQLTGKVVEDERPQAVEDLEMPLEGIRVLLVEDDEDSREMLTTILLQKGSEVTAVDNAPDALRKLRELHPDILISDVGLPREDGYDLIRKVRALPDSEGGSTPAVALTGYVSLQDRASAIAAGFQEHLAKPVDTVSLIDVIGKLVAAGHSTEAVA